MAMKMKNFLAPALRSQRLLDLNVQAYSSSSSISAESQATLIPYAAAQGKRSVNVFSVRPLTGVNQFHTKPIPTPARIFQTGPQFSTKSGKQNTFHETMWKNFFEWLGRKMPLIGSRYGLLMTKFDGVVNSFLGMFVVREAGIVYTNDEAIKKFVDFIAPKTTKVSLSFVGSVLKFFWSLVAETSVGKMLLGVAAVYTGLTGQKALRSVCRSLGMEVKEPVDQVAEQQIAIVKLSSAVSEMGEKLSKEQGLCSSF